MEAERLQVLQTSRHKRLSLKDVNEKRRRSRRDGDAESCAEVLSHLSFHIQAAELECVSL